MRAALCFSSLILCLACEPPKTYVFSSERLPPGVPVTVHVLGLDPAGLEHELSKVLKDAGYDVRSSAAVSLVVSRTDAEGDALSQEALRRYATRYVCRVKATANSRYVHTYTIQLIDIETGRILLSLQRAGHLDYAPTTVADHLRQALK